MEFTKRDKAIQFKSDLRSLERWKREVKSLTTEIENLDHELQGVGSIGVKDICVTEGTKVYSDHHRLQLIAKKTSLEKNRNLLAANISITQERLNNIPECPERELIIKLYVLKTANEKILPCTIGAPISTAQRKINNVLAENY